MVKLNIEMTMAALIAKIASGSINNLNEIWYQGEGRPPEYNYNYENPPHVRQGSTGSGQDLMPTNLTEWPTVLNGTTWPSASVTVRQLGDSNPIKSNLNSIEASQHGPSKMINTTSNDREISIATEERGGRGSTSVTMIRESERPRFGILGKTMGCRQNPNSSEGNLGGSDPGQVSHESRIRNEKKLKPSLINDDGDDIGRPRSN